MLVDGFDRNRPEDEAVIIDDRELFFALLVFMSRVAEVIAPVFTTVLEPSPWRTEVSSCSVSLR